MRRLMPALSDRQLREMRYAIRVGAAAVGAYVVSTASGLPQGFWSVISAVIVVQASIGGTFVAAQERAIGTIVGAALGGIAASLQPHNATATAIKLAGCTTILAYAAAHRPSLRIAPITATILITTTGNTDNSFMLGIDRVLEIFLGCGAGVAATALLFPRTRQSESMHDVESLVREVASLILLRAEELSSGTVDPLQRQHDVIRQHISRIEKEAGEARRAPGGRSRSEKRSALVRTLWRVRNDTVAVKRAMEATQTVAPGPTVEPAAALMREQARFLETMGTDAAGRVALDACLTRLNAAIEERSPQDADAKLVLPRLGLVFALQSLTENITDLADRLGELQADMHHERFFSRLYATARIRFGGQRRANSP